MKRFAFGGGGTLLCALAALVTGGCLAPSPYILNEPLAFTLPEKQIPLIFGEYRSDAEIRGRLLAGVWENTDVVSQRYVECYAPNGMDIRVNQDSRWPSTVYRFRENGTCNLRTVAMLPDGVTHTFEREARWEVRNALLRITYEDQTSTILTVDFPDDGSMVCRIADLPDMMARNEKMLRNETGGTVLGCLAYNFWGEDGCLYGIQASTYDKNGDRYHSRTISRHDPGIFRLKR